MEARDRTTSVRRGVTLSLLFAALAAVTVGAKCPGGLAKAPKRPARTVARTASDSADQLMFGVRGVLTHGSVSRGILVADSALVSKDGTEYGLRNLRITFSDTAGVKTSELMARTGVYYLKRGRVEPRGEVTIVGKDGRRLQTARVVFDLARNVITGDTAYTFVETNPPRQRTGSMFEADPQLLQVRNPARQQRSASSATGAR